MAGTHLRGLDSEYNITPAADLLREGGEAIGFCSWREGLVLRPELAWPDLWRYKTWPGPACGW